MTDFEYLKLEEINPDIPAIPEGDYDLRVIDAKREQFTYKTNNPDRGITAGDTASYVKLTFAIVNNAEWAGRRVYAALFPDQKSFRYLRILQDATGINQTSTLDAWLQTLAEAKPTVRGPVYNQFNKRTEKDEPAIRFTGLVSA